MAPEAWALKEDEAQRLKASELENARLKRIVAEQSLDILMLKDGHRETGELVPAAGRARVLVRKHRVSEPRACRVVGQYRSTNRYVAVPGDFEARLVAAMKGRAGRFPQYEYRRVHALLVAEGWRVNVKRVERLWALEDVQVPKRRRDRGQKAFGTREFSAWALPALRRIHIWSDDFVSVRLLNGSAFRVLNVVDEYTRVALGSRIRLSIGARDVTKHLAKLFEEHGRPEMIRSDNGREFVAETVKDWLRAQAVERSSSPRRRRSKTVVSNASTGPCGTISSTTKHSGRSQRLGS